MFLQFYKLRKLAKSSFNFKHFTNSFLNNKNKNKSHFRVMYYYTRVT